MQIKYFQQSNGVMNILRQGYKLQCSQINPTNPTQNRVKLGSLRRYIIGLNPNLNPILGQHDLTRPWGPTRPDSAQSLGSKSGVQAEKRVGFGRNSTKTSKLPCIIEGVNCFLKFGTRLYNIHACAS